MGSQKRNLLDKIIYAQKKGLVVNGLVEKLKKIYQVEEIKKRENQDFSLLTKKEAEKQREKFLENLRYTEKELKKDDQKIQKTIKLEIKLESIKQDIRDIESTFRFFGCTKLEHRGNKKLIDRADDKELGTFEEIRKQYITLIKFGAFRYGTEIHYKDYVQELETLLIHIYQAKKATLGKKAFSQYFKASMWRHLADLKKEEQQRAQKVGLLQEKLEHEKPNLTVLEILSEDAKELLNALKKGYTLEELVLEGKKSKAELMQIFAGIEKAIAG